MSANSKRGESTGIRGLALNTSANAMVFRRWLGAWIDFVVCFGLLGLGIELFEGNSSALVIADAVLIFGYFIGLEVAVGATLGKLVTGIRVVNAQGDKPSILAACIRTAMRLIEVNPFIFGGIPAGVAVNYSKTKQRLGDRMAGTFVLKRRDLLAARSARE